MTNVNSRPYRQVARAAAMDRTQQQILDAVDAAFDATGGVEFTLEEIAARAGTTVQTVLRHFGSKSGLVGAAARRGANRVQAERDEVPCGDVGAVARYLTRHYETDGDRMLRLLAIEDQSTDVAQITANGRRLHRAWVERILVPLFEPFGAADRRRIIASLVAVTDLLTWKLLRRDQGLSQRDYQRSVTYMLDALIACKDVAVNPSGHTPERSRVRG